MQVAAKDKKMALRAIAIALPILILIATIPVISWRGDDIQEQGRKKLIDGISLSFAAMELKFHAADFNGWQTAYALDNMRGVPDAAKDSNRSRRAFLDSATRFKTQLEAMEKLSLSTVERNSLTNIKRHFNEFMHLDEEIIAAYRSQDANARRYATALVMGAEIDLFNAISNEVESLAGSITRQLMQNAAEAESSGRSARWLLVGSAGIALLLALGVVVMVQRWIATTHELMGRLEQLALTDHLTGIPNRRAWNDRLVTAMAQAKRHKYQLAFAIIDLDFFKKFNDQNGHLEGDMLLQEVARRLSVKMRTEDIFARFGGEEFVVLLVDCDSEAARIKIDEMRQDMPRAQTFSAGITVWNGQESAESALVRADKALYRAKENGRNCTVVAES